MLLIVGVEHLDGDALSIDEVACLQVKFMHGGITLPSRRFVRIGRSPPGLLNYIMACLARPSWCSYAAGSSGLESDPPLLAEGAQKTVQFVALTYSLLN